MITSKELLVLIISIIILSFSNSLYHLENFTLSLIFFAIIIVTYTFAKKIMAYYLESNEEMKLWTFQRYGYRERNYFKTPIPIGIILSFLLPIMTLGYVKWFAVTESEISTTPARAARRHGYYSFSEISEYQLGLIMAAGIFSMFVVSIVAYLFNYPELSRLSVYFAAFNMIPISKLDGARIFFGSRTLYTIMLVLTLIGLMYAFLLA